MIAYIFIAAIFLYLGSLFWKRRQWTNLFPPGPPALPILGNLFQIDPADPRKTFVKWHKKFGPIFTVWLGNRPMIFVTDYDLMQELFVKRGEEFADRPYSFLFNIITNGNNGIVNCNGEKWKDQRRFSLHVLRDFGLGRKLMEEKILAEATNFLSAIESRLRGSSPKSINIKPLLDVCISNVISSVVLGRTHTADDPAFRQIKDGTEKLTQVLGSATGQMLESFPWLRYIPLFNHFAYDDIQRIRTRFLGVIAAELEKHKREMHLGAEPDDFASVYLKEMERRRAAGEDLGYFDEFQLTVILANIWGAGMETTVTTLSWAILLMMHNPEVQKKVQKEIDDVVGFERYPTMSDRASMPYTGAVIHEVQRYANILLSNLFRTVKVDTEIRGYTIPAGTTIIPQISVLHFDDAIFDHPFEFDPDRFLDDTGKLDPKLTEKVTPFSLGKRICLGEGLARMELFIIFTCLLQKFSLSFVNGEPHPNLKPNYGFSVTPSPYRLCLTKRQE